MTSIKKSAGRPIIFTPCPICKKEMGRALLRVHIARCGGRGGFISEANEALMLLEQAFQIEPRLSYFGIGLYCEENPPLDSEKFTQSQERLQCAVQELIDCEAWLTGQRRTKAITAHYSSYRLKHIVEHYERRYVSNGALCAMAIGLGFKYRTEGANIFINIAKNLYKYDGTAVA